MSAPKRENMFLNLAFNLIVPILLLNKGEKWLPSLSPGQVMTVALLFPLGYFAYDWYTRRKFNLLSVIGALSVGLTGGIGLLKMGPHVLAVKEAIIPLLLGVAVVASLKTRRPLVRALLYNPEIFNAEKIEGLLDTQEKRSGFDRLLVQCTWLIAASFLVSAVLNYVLTRIIVTTDPRIDAASQAAFNSEVGTQYWVSFIVIAACTLPLTFFALFKLFGGIKQLTGLGMEEVLQQPESAGKKPAEAASVTAETGAQADAGAGAAEHTAAAANAEENTGADTRKD